MARTGSKGGSASTAANAVPQNGLLRTEFALILQTTTTMIHACAARQPSQGDGIGACEANSRGRVRACPLRALQASRASLAVNQGRVHARSAHFH
jgi:hypothetical protein